MDKASERSRVRRQSAHRTGAELRPLEGRRPYRQPTLVRYGSLASLTLGGSPGVGDSGNPFAFNPPFQG